MKRIQSFFFAALVTVALSSNAFAGNIYGIARNGNIYGVAREGNIYGIVGSLISVLEMVL